MASKGLICVLLWALIFTFTRDPDLVACTPSREAAYGWYKSLCVVSCVLSQFLAMCVSHTTAVICFCPLSFYAFYVLLFVCFFFFLLHLLCLKILCCISYCSRFQNALAYPWRHLRVVTCRRPTLSPRKFSLFTVFLKCLIT